MIDWRGLYKFCGSFVEADTPHPILGTPCWLWLDNLDSGGYGAWYRGSLRGGIPGKLRCTAHKAAFLYLVGEIPEGWDVDHLCRVHRCVNPDHLEAVTRKENIRRGAGRGGKVLDIGYHGATIVV